MAYLVCRSWPGGVNESHHAAAMSALRAFEYVALLEEPSSIDAVLRDGLGLAAPMRNLRKSSGGGEDGRLSASSRAALGMKQWHTLPSDLLPFAEEDITWLTEINRFDISLYAEAQRLSQADTDALTQLRKVSDSAEPPVSARTDRCCGHACTDPAAPGQRPPPSPTPPTFPPPPPTAKDKNFTLAGKSVYFVMVDRFARPGTSNAPCEENGWCGGRLRELTARLDYIAGMGFDCVWITPVTQQLHGESCDSNGWCGYGYHGYWTQNFDRIDPAYGTADDLASLARELHARDMCVDARLCQHALAAAWSTSLLRGFTCSASQVLSLRCCHQPCAARK